MMKHNAIIHHVTVVYNNHFAGVTMGLTPIVITAENQQYLQTKTDKKIKQQKAKILKSKKHSDIRANMKSSIQRYEFEPTTETYEFAVIQPIINTFDVFMYEVPNRKQPHKRLFQRLSHKRARQLLPEDKEEIEDAIIAQQEKNAEFDKKQQMKLMWEQYEKQNRMRRRKKHQRQK